MTELYWRPAPLYGSCLGCGSSQNDRGFVDTLVDKEVRSEGEPVGIVDAVFCAHCVEQMGQLVGMASKAQVDDFAYSQLEKDTEIEKLKDEVAAWQARFDVMFDKKFVDSVKEAMKNADNPARDSGNNPS